MEKENDTIKVKNAINAIDSSIKSIGDISDPYTPLGKLSDEAKSIENNLNSLKSQYEEVWRLQERCNDLNHEIDSLLKKKENILNQIKSYEVKSVLEKLNKIKELRSSYEQLKSEIVQIEKYKDVSSSEIISLERSEATLQELERNLKTLESKYKKASERLRDLEKNIEIYEQRFKIRDFSDIDKLYLRVKNINLSYGIVKERMRMLKDLENDLDELRKKSENVLKEYNILNEKLSLLGDLEEFNREIKDYLDEKDMFEKSNTNQSYGINARLILTDKNTGKFKFAIFSGILIAIFGVLLGFFINPWLYLVGIGGLVLSIAYFIEIMKLKSSFSTLSKKMEELKQGEEEHLSKLQSMERKILKALQIAGIRSIEEYSKMYEKYMSIRNTNNSDLMDEKIKEINKLKSDIDNAMMDIDKDLASFNVISDGDIEKAIALLNDQIDSYKNLSFEKGKLLEDSNRFKLELNELKRKISDISGQISSVLASLGFDNMESYRMALEKKERYFKLFTDLKEIEIDLEKSDSARQEEFEQYIEENRSLLNIEPKATKKQLNSQLNDIEENINIKKAQLTNLLSSLEKKESSLQSLGYLKAHLSYLNHKISVMIDKKNSLVKLLSIMKEFYEMVKRDFIPKLNKQVSEIFNGIVENDQYNLKLNDNLEIEVIYKGENITSNISTGTYHQLALSLKLALASIMSTSEESLPILLDDAFSEYDVERIKPTVKFLKSISKKIQIIISSCRNDVADTAKSLKFKTINLG
jgi:DNA repair exonuclease SbcCD ATPase subunit